MAHCVLVKGPCRGKMCDFWARVRIGKLHTDELEQELRNSISCCEDDIGTNLDNTFSQYWTSFGIKDFRRFCDEEPELYYKVKQAEERIRKTMP